VADITINLQGHHLQPGDTLLIRIPPGPDWADAESIQEAMTARLPGINVVVLYGDCELLVSHPDPPTTDNQDTRRD
jgi:hypothetical protein